jgi:hypothetical protein
MKKWLFIIGLILSLYLGVYSVSCMLSRVPFTWIYHSHKFNSYSDSARKYRTIRTECGNNLSGYYYNLSREEYKKAYPNGNPASEEKKDTICYPINK